MKPKTMTPAGQNESPGIRDQIAMAAMQGMIANSQVRPQDIASMSDENAAKFYRRVARESYRYADAMIAHRDGE
jgi:hypothetical protein